MNVLWVLEYRSRSTYPKWVWQSVGTRRQDITRIREQRVALVDGTEYRVVKYVRATKPRARR